MTPRNCETHPQLQYCDTESINEPHVGVKIYPRFFSFKKDTNQATEQQITDGNEKIALLSAAIEK